MWLIGGAALYFLTRKKETVTTTTTTTSDVGNQVNDAALVHNQHLNKVLLQVQAHRMLS
jgi:hypothetical protein